jgi:hypothetical protein
MKTLELFPTVVLMDECPANVFSNIKKEIESNFEKINLYLGGGTCGDNIHTTFKSSNNKNAPVCIISKLNLINTKQFLDSYIKEYVKLEFSSETRSCILKQSWINIITPLGFQNTHTHGFDCISGVLYLDIPENSGDFRIHPGYYDNQAVHSITPFNGLITVFRGSTPHSVAFNKSSKQRISLAFNCYFV